MGSDASAPRSAAAAGAAGWRDIWRITPLSRAAARVVVALVVAIIAVEIAFAVVDAGAEPLTTTVAEILITACFALFAVHPPTATLVLLAGASLALGRTGAEQTLLALAVASGFVVATCSRALSLVYCAGLILWVLVVIVFAPGAIPGTWVVVLAILAAASAAIGWSVRRLRERTSALSTALERRERAAEEAARLERQRISDELHDVIAHELTIISMHASVLERTDDSALRAESEAAIRDAARQALADIRRLLDLTAPPDGEEGDGGRRRLRSTLTDVERELRAVGMTVDARGFDAAGSLSPTVDIALARVLREAATNVAKHGRPDGAVEIALAVEDGEAILTVVNPVGGGSARTRLALPSGGYGLARMRERMRVLGGALEAAPTDGGWRVHARLPQR